MNIAQAAGALCRQASLISAITCLRMQPGVVHAPLNSRYAPTDPSHVTISSRSEPSRQYQIGFTQVVSLFGMNATQNEIIVQWFAICGPPICCVLHIYIFVILYHSLR
jgi:hypothetical protein